MSSTMLPHITVHYCRTECSLHIKIHGSELRGQGGSSKQHPDRLKTHTLILQEQEL